MVLLTLKMSVTHYPNFKVHLKSVIELSKHFVFHTCAVHGGGGVTEILCMLYKCLFSFESVVEISSMMLPEQLHMK